MYSNNRHFYMLENDNEKQRLNYYMASLTKAGVLAIVIVLCFVMPINTNFNVETTTKAGLGKSLGNELSVKIYHSSGTFDPLKESPKIPKELITHKPNGYWIVQFKGPVYEEWRLTLEQFGEVIAPIADFAFLVKADLTAKAKIQELPFVRWLGIYEPGYKIQSSILERTDNEEVSVVVVTFESSYDSPWVDLLRAEKTSSKANTENLDEVLAQIDKYKLLNTCERIEALANSKILERAEYISVGGEEFREVSAENLPEERCNVESFSRVAEEEAIPLKSTVKIITKLTVKEIKQLAFNPSVQWIEEYDENEKFLADEVLYYSGAWLAHENYGVDGTGVVVAMQDNGLQWRHIEFGDNPNPNSDADATPATNEQILVNLDDVKTVGDHGTLAAGVIIALGKNPYARGIAPGAKLVNCEDSTSFNYDSDISTAYSSYGARVSTNSYPTDSSSGYGTEANEIDAMVRSTKNYVLVFAFGNSGAGLSTPDYTAKNGIGVGGMCDRATVNPNDDCYDSQASRGPQRDGRWAPDLSAPAYWNVYSTDLLGTAGDSKTEGAEPLDYMSFSGTSCACPVVAGVATLVVQDYKRTFGDTPRTSTVKALLINTARNIGLEGDAYGTKNYGAVVGKGYGFGACDADGNGIIGEDLYGGDGIIDEVGVVTQGWGVPDISKIIGKLRNFYIDNETTTVGTDEYAEYKVQALGTEPLKITLVWTDQEAASTTGEAKALINDFDLNVTAPTGTYYLGNNFGPNSVYTLSGDWYTIDTRKMGPDRLNNVENVYIENPEANGVYTIRVSGYSVSYSANRYTLVVSGCANVTGRAQWIGANFYNYYNATQGVINIIDNDLDQAPTTQESVSIKIYSKADPKGIDISCKEVGVNSAVFTAPINFTTTGVSDAATNTILVYADNDVVTAKYTDASPSATVYANVSYDRVPPKVSNVFIRELAPASAILQWDTNELSKGQVWINDVSAGIWEERDFYARDNYSGGWQWDYRSPFYEHWYYHHAWYITTRREHKLAIKANTTYKFQLNVTDKAGNWAIADNSGTYYWFRTPNQSFKVLFVDHEYIDLGTYTGKLAYGWIQSYYLNITGIYHDYWWEYNNWVTLDQLRQYDIVVWTTGCKGKEDPVADGDTYNVTPGDEINKIIGYLDSAAVNATGRKPRMLITGVNSAYDASSALKTRLSISVIGTTSSTTVYGVSYDWLGS
ncbi:MAG: S8 family serine peptidase, partial [Candidatus Thermoplasmatota archaeon]